jgi:tetratricopeptide (TPR) repeat protein
MEAFGLSVEAFGLSVAGERASQARAAEIHQTFFSASIETLDLVNGTLGLAKDASDRAANAIQRKAEASLVEIDRAARRLISQVPEQDDRAIVSEQIRRSEVISLAHKIAGFEVNRFILPTDLPLTPACLFIRGMQFHLEQRFEEALDCWDGVALDSRTEDRLRSTAWYWIGYERNNLGQFAAAEQSFDQARSTASGARLYELRRIQLESRFFNKSKESAADLIGPYEDLLRAVAQEGSDEHIEAVRVKILATLGNVQHRAGEDALEAGNMAVAAVHFRAALKAFEHAEAAKDRWAGFGLAEAAFRLQDLDRAYSLFRGPVRRRAVDEYLNRVEPRTRVLARTTELLCCIRVPDLEDEVPTTFNNVVEALGQVDERLTVYSQIQRRNITIAEFRQDLASLAPETAIALTPAPPHDQSEAGKPSPDGGSEGGAPRAQV